MHSAFEKIEEINNGALDGAGDKVITLLFFLTTLVEILGIKCQLDSFLSVQHKINCVSS